MKLIIQIPCYNEENTLAETVRDLPKKIDGIDSIEYLVILDGCTDKTEQVAKECGVHHVLPLGRNFGLATAFMRGLDYALLLGADIVVNTDGDNQYSGFDIPKLVEPILSKRADMVVGARPIVTHPEFGFFKKILQVVGSWALRRLSKTHVKDAPSGFRAYSRETCMKLHLHSTFSHCTESLIQAGHLGLTVESVDININPKTRDSRLFSSVSQYVWKQGKTMLSMFLLYRPGVFFFCLGLLFIIPAFILGIKFLDAVYIHPHQLHRAMIPSLILLAMLGLFGFISWSLGVIGDLVKNQRRISEEQLFITKKRYYD
jgi:glycosyltransferase involved in cell wall biosynthesis